MIAVSDTGPLNYLILLGCIDILPQLYGEAVVPSSVLSELRHQKAPIQVREWASSLPGWARLMRAVQSPETGALAGLDPGETEAILLAEQLGADLLLMDDLEGRTAAKVRGLKVGGTLSVLAAASGAGLINLDESVRRLRKLGFRASENLVRDLLAECSIRPPS